jgi:CDP-glucose 4,6-dehydratase
MTFLLEHLNVPVVGYALSPESDSLFVRGKRDGLIPEVFADIRDYSKLEFWIDLHKPAVIIHMAAQPIVLKSYVNPHETFDINVMGTANVLDIAFKRDFIKTVIVVTTDKVYRNDNSGKAFIETDPLQGKDPYSASKVGTESVISAWQQIALISGGPQVISVRSGNVIGGGDFSENRLIPDLIRGVIKNESVSLRNPESTRPWQHVLDPLRGYLMAAEESLSNVELKNLNFGPIELSISVREVAEIAKAYFPKLDIEFGETAVFNAKESLFLNLDSSLSFKEIKWKPTFSQDFAINSTFEWWRKLLDMNSTAQELCKVEIEFYLESDFDS